MPLHPGHSDEVREKNVKEMIAAGHEPKQAVAAAYANQRKYRKMALGGMIPKDQMTDEAIQEDLNDEHERGMFEMMQASHLDEHDSYDSPESHEALAKALAGSETEGNGTPDSDIDEEETVDLPETEFVRRAQDAIEARKKKKAIIP